MIIYELRGILQHHQPRSTSYNGKISSFSLKLPAGSEGELSMENIEQRTFVIQDRPAIGLVVLLIKGKTFTE